MAHSRGKTQARAAVAPEVASASGGTLAAASTIAVHLKRTTPIYAAVVFVLSLGLYRWTLAPTVTLVDSGELIVAARTLGVAHPPGVPLYVLLTHLVTLLPAGSVAARVNFASALFGALAAAMLTLVVAEALLSRSSVTERRRKGRKPERDKRTRASERQVTLATGLALVPALIGGLVLAFSRTLWSYATVAEVYTLNTLLILTVFFLMFRWRRLSLEESQPHASARAAGSSRQRDRWLYAAAFVFGLSLCVHHVTAGLTLPAFAALVYSTEGLKFFKSKRLLYAALFAFAGLGVYVYLPIAASRPPLLNWGDPSTLKRIWWHITGRQYQVFFSDSEDVIGTEARQFARIIFREFGPWWLPAAPALSVAGVVDLFRRNRAIFYFLILVVLADLSYSLNYRIAEDKEAYYLPAFISVAITVAFGAQWLIRMAGAGRFSAPIALREYAACVAAGILLLVPVAGLAANFRFNDRSRYFIARDYVDNITSTIGKHGMLLTLDWQVYSPMLYFREIENRRRDIVTVDVNLLRRSWYFDYLRRQYPDLIERTSDKVDAYLEDLRHWEEEPKAYELDPALNQRINSRFRDMVLAFVNSHIRTASVYVTEDIAAGMDPQNVELTKSLTSTYQLVPQGLVFQAIEDRSFHEPAEPALLTRGLSDGTLKFEENDVVMLKVIPVYSRMLTNRGRYLAAHGQHRRAIEAFKQALAIDPGFRPAAQSLAESERVLRQGTGAAR